MAEERISQDIGGRTSAAWKAAENSTSSRKSDYSSSRSKYFSSNSSPISNANLPASPTIANNPRLVRMMNNDTDILLNHGIVDRYDVDWYNKFSRFGFVDPYNGMKHTKEYIFITKPDLNLIDTKTGQDVRELSPFFSDAYDRYIEVAMQLQYSKSSDYGPFCQLLSNSVNGSLELPDISADTIETSKTVYGTQISYRGTSYKSDQDFDFSLEFKDSKFLEVYMFFKMYDEYERLKWMGQVSPKEIYITSRILHDQVSIYKFIVAEDGMTILYFARAMGCIPLSVPRDAMTNIDGELTFSVNWKAQFVYDMDPRILVDFNKISENYRRNKAKLELYNTTSKTAEGRWSSCPYIMTRREASNRKERYNRYYLFWTV